MPLRRARGQGSYRVMRVPFTKMEGLGNDFIVMRQRLLGPKAAARLCDRRRGIGADGVLTLLPPQNEGDARMHVYNADGSVAEMCGNGLRCVISALGLRHARVETDAGLREGWQDQQITVTLGEAKLIDSEIEVKLGTQTVFGTAISMGNPHLVLPAFDADTDLVAMAERYGFALERHPRFPGRVNVGFPKQQGEDLALVVFERGSGITQACGTGAGAAAVAMIRRGWRSPVRVLLPGGLLTVEVTGDVHARAPGAALGQVRITGPARPVFDGTVEIADDEWLDTDFEAILK